MSDPGQTAPAGRGQTDELRIRIGGPAGFGIKAAGQSLARLFARSGFHTFDLTEYPSLIKGGHNTYHLRVSANPIHSHVLSTDILVSLDRDTVGLHSSELTPGAAVIFDPNDLDVPDTSLDPERYCLTPVPLTRIVRDVGGPKVMRNVAALGAVLGHMNFELAALEDSIKEQFAHKEPEIAEQNIAVARAGYEYAREHACAFPHHLSPPTKPHDPRMLVDGNEAIGLGALAAGIGLYCAYPMTPASSLLHFMAKHGDAQDVVVKHTEDELAAMNMVVGGAFGGTRSMCATSGGGFSLMVEAFGLAGVSETAVLVGVFTRPGPATGMPTWTEQSDLRFVLHAAQGEFPRVVLAPGDVEEAFELTWQAFNLADVLQTPVVLLGDAYLSDNRRTVDPFDQTRVTIDRGKLVSEGDVGAHRDTLGTGGQYLRYKLNEDGVSVRVLPGVVGATQVVNSYEHDEKGYGAQGERASIRIAQNEKRLRKLETARTIVPRPKHHGPQRAPLSFIVFGTTKQPALEAMDWLSGEGVDLNMLQLVTVWPFPAHEVSSFLDGATRTLVIEGNATGQLEGLVRQECLRAPDGHLHRFDGRPLSPEQIYVRAKQELGLEVSSLPSGARLEELVIPGA